MAAAVVVAIGGCPGAALGGLSRERVAPVRILCHLLCMNRYAVIWLALGLLACGGEPLEDDDEEPGLILSNPTDTDGFSPYVSDGEMICNPGTTSPDTLNVVVRAGDPQGSDTLDSDGRLSGYAASGDAVFEDLLMPCNTSGECTAGFTINDYAGLDCDSAWDYTFYARVMDEEGNVSEPGVVEYTGQ